jgi:hypothetical protein
LTKDSSLLLHLLPADFYRKPYPTPFLKIRTKIHETRNLESLHESHFVERKNEDRKPEKAQVYAQKP